MAAAGRRSSIPDEVLRLMLTWREAGESLPKIARRLNETKVPTPGGGAEWYPQSVRQAILAEEKRREKALAASRTRTGKRTITITVDAMPDEAFAQLANAVWFVTNACASGSDFYVEPGRVDDQLLQILNDHWSEQPPWGE